MSGSSSPGKGTGPAPAARARASSAAARTEAASAAEPEVAFVAELEAAFVAELETALACRARRLGRLEGFRPAAVLVPLVPRRDGLHLAFIRRVEDGRIHSGQVAFPGGGMEAEDQDIYATALREAEEEVGIPPSSVRILGALDDSATISSYIVTPVVGLVTELPDYRLDPREAQEVFEVPLAFLLDPSNERQVEDVEFLGHRWPLFEYRFGGKLIWGATGRILNDLLTLARALPSAGAHGAPISEAPEEHPGETP